MRLRSSRRGWSAEVCDERLGRRGGQSNVVCVHDLRRWERFPPVTEGVAAGPPPVAFNSAGSAPLARQRFRDVNRDCTVTQASERRSTQQPLLLIAAGATTKIAVVRKPVRVAP